MADVVELPIKKGDPEIVESLRTLVSEALNGRITSVAFVYLDDEGTTCTGYLTDNVSATIGQLELLKAELLTEWANE